MNKDYSAMAGLHGCMPNYCAGHDSYNDAVEDLITMHELDQTQSIDLYVNGYLELDLGKHGNAYCQVMTEPVGLD